MIINRLSMQYRCGCEQGQAEYKETGILESLNRIIEWKQSFDEKKLESGQEKELVPGDVIEIKSTTGTKNVCAIDSPDRLIMLVSETGPLALNRLVENIVKPELELLEMDTMDLYKMDIEFFEHEPDGVDFPGYSKISISDLNYYSIIQERILPSKLLGKKFYLKVTFSHDLTFGEDVTIWITSRDILYDPLDFCDNPGIVRSCFKDIMGYCYQMMDRIPRPTIDWEELNNDRESLARFFKEYEKIFQSMIQSELDRFIELEGLESSDYGKEIAGYIREIHSGKSAEEVLG